MSFNCQRPLEYILTRISSYLFVFHETRGGGRGGGGEGGRVGVLGRDSRPGFSSSSLTI